MTLLSDLNNKKILILGIGKEGIDTLFFLKKKIKYKSIGIADILDIKDVDPHVRKSITAGIKTYFGKNYMSSISNYDVIIKSPGIPLHTITKKKKQIVTSQSDIFLTNCKKTIIGITGTKGKSTTCVLLNDILNNAGKESRLIGNIGKPPLLYLLEDKKNDYFVYELSSFQLQTITKSPHIAVFLNLFKDHLDKHKNFEEYVSSKANITFFQKENDFFVFNESNNRIKKIAEKSIAKKIPFSFNDYEEPILKVLEILKIEKKFLTETIKNFKSLPHRLEYLGTFQDIHFYDDSAATIPEAVIKAIKEIKNLQTIVMGGTDKGADFSSLIEIIRKSKIQNIILFKGSNKNFEKEIHKTGKFVFPATDMKEAVDFCFQNTDRGKSCLLSPGFASFNMFKDYKERGELFKKYVFKQK
jgi:UDP-N-acetylmuramoyl-L-alanine---L-glutamate ligase